MPGPEHFDNRLGEPQDEPAPDERGHTDATGDFGINRAIDGHRLSEDPDTMRNVHHPGGKGDPTDASRGWPT